MRSLTLLSLVLTSLLSAFFAPAARAQVIHEEVDYSSPQFALLSLKFGPYAPNIDQEFSDRTPFQDLFGDDQGLLFTTELDVILWRGFGMAMLGASIGYSSLGVKPFFDDGNDTTPATIDDDNRLEGETTITTLPIAILGVYAFDVLAERWNIPLVPYVKFGINYTLWWMEKGDGSTSEVNGDEAAGGTWGWQINVGGAFLLDVLEPKAAKILDSDMGINHTYLFFELAHVQADGFGSSERLNVGDTSWNGGLALQF